MIFFPFSHRLAARGHLCSRYSVCRFRPLLRASTFAVFTLATHTEGARAVVPSFFAFAFLHTVAQTGRVCVFECVRACGNRTAALSLSLALSLRYGWRETFARCQTLIEAATAPDGFIDIVALELCRRVLVRSYATLDGPVSHCGRVFLCVCVYSVRAYHCIAQARVGGVWKRWCVCN